MSGDSLYPMCRSYRPSLLSFVICWTTAISLSYNRYFCSIKHGSNRRTNKIFIAYTKKLFPCLDELTIRLSTPVFVPHNPINWKLGGFVVVILLSFLDFHLLKCYCLNFTWLKYGNTFIGNFWDQCQIMEYPWNYRYTVISVGISTNEKAM